MSTFALGPTQVRRSGYGAMQFPGSHTFGTGMAIGVLQAAVAAGVDRIDTPSTTAGRGRWPGAS
jgi:aryl-alcohol dehydrogenase-like predicted oxidoreductase